MFSIIFWLDPNIVGKNLTSGLINIFYTVKLDRLTLHFRNRIIYIFASNLYCTSTAMCCKLTISVVHPQNLLPVYRSRSCWIMEHFVLFKIYCCWYTVHISVYEQFLLVVWKTCRKSTQNVLYLQTLFSVLIMLVYSYKNKELSSLSYSSA